MRLFYFRSWVVGCLCLGLIAVSNPGAAAMRGKEIAVRSPTSPIVVLSSWAQYLDKNDDGSVTRVEWQDEMRAAFARMDQDDDGYINSHDSLSDYLPITKKTSESAPSRTKATASISRNDALLIWAQNSFFALDANGNGVIETEERSDEMLLPIYDMLNLRLMGQTKISIQGRSKRALNKVRLKNVQFYESAKEVFNLVDYNQNERLSLLEIVANILPYEKPKRGKKNSKR